MPPGDNNNLESNLTLDISSFRASLRRVTSDVSRFGQDFKKAFEGFSGPANRATKEMNEVQKSTKQATQEVKRMAIGLKDLERIVGGILLSQAFYGTKAAIEDAAAALFDFLNQIEKAQIALEYFLATPEQATGFLKDVQKLAAETAFDTQQALSLSRRLLAAQFDPNNVIDVITTLNDAAAASGGTAEQLDRIVLALTQIRTNGKLAGQEIRQLGEAGIPIYQILQEELGLTGEEVLNSAELKIPGEKAVNAILAGLEKRYKGAADRIADTIPGLVQTIQDDSKIIGAAIFQNPYDGLQKLLLVWRDTFSRIRDLTFEGGLGKALEELVPPEIQGSIRRVAASLNTLGRAFLATLSAIKPVAQVIGGAFFVALGIILPPIAALANALANLAKFATNSVPGIKYLVAALGTVLVATVAAKAVLFFWGVLRLATIARTAAVFVTAFAKSISRVTVAILRNPVVLGIVLLTTAILHFTVGVREAITWIDTLINRLAGLAGIDADLALPNVPAPDASIDDYTSAWEGIGAGAADAGDEAEAADKKFKKFLASFDEIFQVAEDEEDRDFDLPIPDIGGNIPGLGTDLPDKIELPELVLPSIDDITLPPLFRKIVDRTFRWPGWPPYPPFPGVPVIEIGPAFDRLKERVRDRLEDLKEFVGGLEFDPVPAPVLAPSWAALGNAIKGILGNLVPSFDIPQIPSPVLAPGWGTLADRVRTSLQNAFGQGLSVTQAFALSFGAILEGALSIGELRLSRFGENAILSFSTAFASIGTIVAAWGESIQNAFSNLGPALSSITRSILDSLADFWDKWGGLITEIVFLAFSVLIGVFTGGLGTIALNLVRWVPKAAGLFRAFGPAVIGYIKNLPAQFITVISGIITKIPSVVKSIADGFLGLGAAILRNIAGIPKMLLDFFKNINIPGLGSIGGAIQSVGARVSLPGYATGGIIQKDHIARVGEGNKREAIIPLQNSNAMAPFAEAVAQLLDNRSSGGGQQDERPILYVANLIADDRSLRDLERRMAVIRLNENARGAK